MKPIDIIKQRIWRFDIQQNNTQQKQIQHNEIKHIGLAYDTQHNWTLSITILCIMLSVII
jgi:hypothetical protein